VHGNSSTCQQSVVVKDDQAPTITCPATVTVNADPGSCAATNVPLGSPTTGDNCGVGSVTNNAPASFPVGTTTVTWTVTDVHGNSATCTQVVTVRDSEPPQFTCPAGITAINDPGQCSGVVNFTPPSGTDNCSGSVTVQTGGLPSGSAFPKGSTLNTFVVTDASGNYATCSFTVTVNDTELPTIACPTDLTVGANSGCSATNVSLVVPAASDNCGVASVTSDAQVTGIPSDVEEGLLITSVMMSEGVATVSWLSETGKTYRLFYKDSLTATNWSAVAGDVTAAGATTSKTDFVGSRARRFYRVQRLANNVTASFAAGTNLVTWTVMDTSGNTNFCVQRVMVLDTTAPAINCPADLFFTADAGQSSRSNVTFGVTATDNCGAPNVVSIPASGSTFPIGTTTVTNTATDASGNQSRCTFTVTVKSGADLAVFVSGPANVITGSNFTYTTTVTNQGPSAAANVLVSDQLPANLVFIGASAGGVFSNGVVTWPVLASLGSGAVTNFFLTNMAPASGSFTNIAAAFSTTSDPNLSNNVSRVSTTAAGASFGILQGATVLNPQTGLFEQRVTVTNTGVFAIPAFKLLVGGLRGGVALHNATGTNVDSRPYALYNASLNPGSYVTMILEFRVPDRQSFTNSLEAVAVLPIPVGTVPVGGVPIDLKFQDNRPGGPRFVIEWTSVPGKTYTIIYSDDGRLTWRIATPSVTVSANRTQWYDDGPPKTISKPVSLNSRDYNVIANP